MKTWLIKRIEKIFGIYIFIPKFKVGDEFADDRTDAPHYKVKEVVRAKSGEILYKIESLDREDNNGDKDVKVHNEHIMDNYFIKVRK